MNPHNRPSQLGPFAIESIEMIRAAPTRRAFLQATVALSGALVSAPVLADADDYRAAVEGMWRRNAITSNHARARQREWIRLATLAPSSHNVQPWKFRLGDDAITILPDFTRRCPAVDPDDSHLYKSLGCAAENLVQAAAADGFHAEVRFDSGMDAVVVTFDRGSTAIDGNLSNAIIERRCTRIPYDGKPVSASVQGVLETAATLEGVTPFLIQPRQQMEAVLEFVRQGNLAQFDDPAFVEELRDWVRFNTRDAIQSGDGLAGIVSGRGSLPRWLGRSLFSMVVSGKKQADLDAKALRSSAGIVVFLGERDDKPSWVAAGRAYERFALQATALGIRNAFINQPIEVRSIRPQLHAWLGVPDRHAHLMVRYGTGPNTLHSLRRPLQDVLIEA